MSDTTAVAEVAQPVVNETDKTETVETMDKEAVEKTAETTEAITETAEITEDKTEKIEKTEETEETEKPEETENIEEKTEKTEEKTEDKKEATGKPDEKVPSKSGQKGNNKRKFDPSVLPKSEDHAVIQTQVHFYFSDSNLPTDKYLWELTGGAENKPVPLKNICQFGRMRRFQSYDTVVAALSQSKFLVLAGEPGSETVARKHAYNPDRPRGKIDAATVYVKGFGEEEPSTQFDLEAFFTQFGAVNAVRLRRTTDNLFKGSVFVEFASTELAEKFVGLDPAPKWKDQDLKIMMKAAYVAEKSELIREGKLEPNTNSTPRFYEGRVSRSGRSGYDKNDWKKRREDDRKNGFRNGNGRGRGNRGSRGFGRGRGGRDWNNHRNSSRQKDEQPPVDATYGKRSREDDSSHAASEPPAKKVDAKPAAAAEAA